MGAAQERIRRQDWSWRGCLEAPVFISLLFGPAWPAQTGQVEGFPLIFVKGSRLKKFKKLKKTEGVLALDLPGEARFHQTIEKPRLKPQTPELLELPRRGFGARARPGEPGWGLQSSFLYCLGQAALARLAKCQNPFSFFNFFNLQHIKKIKKIKTTEGILALDLPGEARFHQTI